MTFRPDIVRAAWLLALAGLPAATSAAEPLRVCADPNNMPFSNRAEQGFENRIAELVAEELQRELEYEWHPQRRGFVRETLNAGKCDVAIGLPMMDMVATTRPYYRSGYVFVSRSDMGIDTSSIRSADLRDLEIGVHLIGDDGANTPPAHALGVQGIVDNVHGYTIYGDYRDEAPPRRLIEAVQTGEVDLVAAWGPLAGYHAQTSDVPLRVTPITDTASFLPLVFQFSIAMGVRREDVPLREALDEIILARGDELRAILQDYGVPLF